MTSKVILQNITDSIVRVLKDTSAVLVKAIKSFSNNRAPEAAATIAYYAFFSLFPLLILIITVISIFIESKNISELIADYIIDIIPVSHSLVDQTVNAVLSQRSEASIIAIIGLFWSASGVFNTLILNINRANTDNRMHNFIKNRLLAMAMVIGLGVFLVVSFFITAILNILPQLFSWINRIIRPSSPLNNYLWVTISQSVTLILRILLFWALYSWVPAVKVKKRVTFTVAVVVALLLYLLTKVFTWYLSSGLISLELIYGSLATVVALLLWIYLGGYVILFGAHLSSAIHNRYYSVLR